MLLSIDPGKQGACALWELDGELVWTMKIRTPPKERFLTRSMLQDIQQMASPCKTVVMEAFLDYRQGHQSPKNDNTTAANHGMIHSACLIGGADVAFLTPKKWKKQMGLLGTDKKASVDLALSLVDREFLLKPRMIVPNEDIAEAVLIGVAYGREHLGWTI